MAINVGDGAFCTSELAVVAIPIGSIALTSCWGKIKTSIATMTMSGMTFLLTLNKRI
jgi:hypothetical protein